MATVDTQSLTAAGAAVTYSDASSGGDRFTPGRHTMLHVVNESVSDVDVTITSPGTVDGLAIADRVVTVPAGSDRMIPVSPAVYRSADGLADVSWEATTSVTFAVIYV